MSFCENCGSQLEEKVTFCSFCGTKTSATPVSVENERQNQREQASFHTANALQHSFQKFNSTKDSTEEFDPQDIQQGIGMGILSYLGILVLIPIITSQHSKFIRFHVNQGLVLFIIDVLFAIINSFFIGFLFLFNWRLGQFVGKITNLGYLILFAYSIIGIINVVNGKAKELPLIGSIRIIK